ncbi:hypothetical protein T484DRAFT_1945053 [Baffinella frigidus]|nr:hypothetical protein T484DRAFT_1945053 [Cryptophyta sp. CCMP2293]
MARFPAECASQHPRPPTPHPTPWRPPPPRLRTTPGAEHGQRRGRILIREVPTWHLEPTPNPQRPRSRLPPRSCRAARSPLRVTARAAGARGPSQQMLCRRKRCAVTSLPATRWGVCGQRCWRRCWCAHVSPFLEAQRLCSPPRTRSPQSRMHHQSCPPAQCAVCASVRGEASPRWLDRALGELLAAVLGKVSVQGRRASSQARWRGTQMLETMLHPRDASEGRSRFPGAGERAGTSWLPTETPPRKRRTMKTRGRSLACS